MKNLWGVFCHIQSSATSLETHQRLGIWRLGTLWGQGAGMTRAGGPAGAAAAPRAGGGRGVLAEVETQRASEAQ